MSNLNRKARTRTLIQLGGLIEKSGLTALFDIELGSDLQLEANESAKAAALLGMLQESSVVAQDNKDQEYSAWKKTGLKLLKK